jgi:hypothetical protein
MPGSPAKPSFTIPCDVCGNATSAGGGRWTGRNLKGCGIWACDICVSSNHDGWGPIREPKLLMILEQKGLSTPSRNAAGWLPLEF